MKINVTRSSMPPFEEYVNEIRDLWDTRWLTNNGIKHRKLESELKSYLGVDNVTLFTNGHLALENLIAAFELKGEVITTPFTFVSTANAITRNALKPVFCDIKKDDYTLDPDLIESLITENTSAIIPVHVYGNACDYKKIESIARKHGLKVIYDAAHAFGEKIDGVGIGSLGDGSMFSFHATKVFNTIEGGCAVFSDSALYDKLTYMKNFGVNRPDTVVYAGGNAKMNEFQAAMGICNLHHLSSYIDERKAADARYRENLTDIKGIMLPPIQKNVIKNYAYFPVVFDGYKYNRDEIAANLAAEDIFARKYFYPLVNDTDCYGKSGAETPIAYQISMNVLTLPLYSGLDNKDIDDICRIITK